MMMNMKHRFLLIIFLSAFLTFTLTAAKQVDVNCRVFDNGIFVDNLGLEDFEILIDGQAQSLESLQMVKGNQVLKSQKKGEIGSTLVRHHALVFSVRHYDPRFDSSIEFFFNQIIQPGDSLSIYTPVKNYTLNPQAIRARGKAELIKQLNGLLRRDTTLGSEEYLRFIRELTRLVGGQARGVGHGGESMEMVLMKYGDLLSSLEGKRIEEQKRLLQYIESHKGKKTPVNVYVFYEKEIKPDYTTQQLQMYQQGLQDNVDILQKLNQYFEFYHRDVIFDLKKISEEFSSSNLQINFMLFRNQYDVIQAVNLREYSSDFFGIFSTLAAATGGIIDSSSNPASAFTRAFEHSKQYYTISFKPSDTLTDKEFHKIKIQVEKDNTKVFHQLGIRN